MAADGQLVKRLDEVRPGRAVARRDAASVKMPVQKKDDNVLVPQRQKPIVTYKINSATAKSKLGSWGKWIFFILAVIVPTVAGGIYYAFFASPQYVSEFRFSVRPNLGASTGSSSADAALIMSNAYIVSDYIGSRDAVVALDKQLDLHQLYSAPGIDAISRLGGDGSVEQMVNYWDRRISTNYDLATGINTVQISAFSPQDAYRIADALKTLCEKLVNQISDAARTSQMEFARTEMERSEKRLKDVRAEDAELRTNQKSIDARKEADGRLQLNLKLQGDLANLQSQYDSLTKYMDPKSPRLSVMRNQIAATTDQISQLQNQIGGDPGAVQNGDMINSRVITRYDQIQTDLEIASKLYESSLTNFETARAQANNNQIYLATYVQPGVPQIASYPRAFFDTFLIFLASCGLWIVLTLVYYSIRDHA